MKNYFFQCDCTKCQDKNEDEQKSSMICPKCEGCVLLSSQCCQKCSRPMDQNTIENYAFLKIEIKTLLSNNDTEGKALEELFKSCVQVFHPYDSTYMQLLFHLYKRRMKTQNHLGCLELSKKILANYKMTCPKYDPRISFHEISDALTCNALEQFDEAKLRFKRAETILQVAYGHKHSLVAKLRDLMMKNEYEKSMKSLKNYRSKISTE